MEDLNRFVMTQPKETVITVVLPFCETSWP
jgi:hypothetical protein